MKKFIQMTLIIVLGCSYLILMGCTKVADQISEALTAVPSITISSASISSVNSSSSVDYQITSSQISEISSMSQSDIVLEMTGSATCTKSISNVTSSTATISFSNCSGDGTVRFYVVSGTAMISKKSSIFNVDNTGAASASFIALPGAYSTIPSTIDIIFPEVMSSSSVSASDFSLGGSCSGVNINGVVVSGNRATISLSGESNCAVGENVILTAALSGMADALGNMGAGSIAGTYSVTNVGPTSGNFLPATSPINSSFNSLILTLPGFIDPSTVDDTDFILSGTCTGISINSVAMSGSDVNISLSDVSGCLNGETILIQSDLSGINDISGNPGSGSASVTYTFDLSAPTLVLSPASSTLASIPASINVTFSNDTDMSQVTLADFTLGGSCFSAQITGLSKVSNVATVQIGSGNLCADTETLQLNVNLADVFDYAGNVAVGTDSVIYTRDSNGPLAILSLNSQSVSVMPGNIQATFDADTNMSTVTSADFSVSGTCGATLGTVNKTGAVTTLNISGAGSCANGQTVVITALFSNVSDLLGNTGTGSESITLTIDNVAPTGVFSLASSSVSLIPSAVALEMSLDTDMDTVVSSAFTVSGTCSVAGLSGISNSGQTVTINLNGTTGCNHGETVVISVSQNLFADLTGNLGSGTAVLNLTVDNVGPVVTLNTVSGSYNPLSTSIIATFSADTDMDTVTTAHFSVAGTCGASLGSLAKSGQTATLNLNGTSACTQDQTVEISVNPLNALDYTGNSGLNNPLVVLQTFDHIGPSSTISPLSGVLSVIPNSITVTFDDDTNMNTVTAADFSITGTCGATLSSVNKSGQVATLILAGTNSCAADTTVRVTSILTGVSDEAGNSGVGTQIQIYTQL
jgi:hypothetical protein